MLLWLPLLGSLANFLPLTKYHWVFEFNREIFFFYLIHHLFAVVYLLKTWRSNRLVLSIFFVLILIYSFAIRVPDFTKSVGAGTQIHFSVFDSTQLQKPALPRMHFEIGIGNGDKSQDGPQIYFQGIGNFLELSDYNPGEGARIFKIETTAGPLTLVALNISTPYDKHSIYDRKVILRRINSLFRHPAAELLGPVIIVGNFGAGPLTWDFQQFWQEDNFKMIPLDWGSGLGLPSPQHLYFAYRGIRGINLVPEHGGILIEVPKGKPETVSKDID